MGRSEFNGMSFTADKIIGETPLVVQFTDTTVGGVAWDWDFGDGITSEEQHPQHTYYIEDSITVTQIVTFSDLTQITYTYENFIYAIQGETIAEEACLRYATEANEGQGWSLFDGDNFIKPADNFGMVKILDGNSSDRVICFDINDFRVYEQDTCDKVIYDRPSPVDKEGVENTEIDWEKRESETVFDVTAEDKFILHDRSFINVRPDDPTNRGANGYTASGLRNSQQLTLEAYIDGEQLSASAVAENFPESGEVVFTGQKIKDNRVQMVVKGASSEITVLNHIHYFLGSDEAKETLKRTMVKHLLQREIAGDMVLHLSRGINPLLNRRTGTSLGSATRIAGPDGRTTSGFSITSPVVMDNPSISGITTSYTVTTTNTIQDVDEWLVYRKVGSGPYILIGTYRCPWTVSGTAENSVRNYVFAYEYIATDLAYGDTFQLKFVPSGYDAGYTVTVVDTIQDVDNWLVYRKVGSGSYVLLDTYKCPWVESGTTEDSVRNYSFAYEYTAIDLVDGDTFQLKFVPSGYDVGSSDKEFESSVYTVVLNEFESPVYTVTWDVGSSNYTVVIWIKSGTGISGVTGFVSQGTFGLWTMYYSKGTTGLPANRTLLAGEYFDIRIYDKQLSADALEYLYNDVITGGKALLPL